MKKNPDSSQRGFFYWIWSPFHVLVFVLLTVLFFMPTIVIVAATDAFIEKVVLELPPSHHGVTMAGFLAASAVAFPIAALMAQTVCYLSSLLRIRGEMEYGQRIASVVAGVLVVLILTHKLHEGLPLENVSRVASLFAGVTIIVLNFVAWVLRKLTGREIIFRHLQELETQQLEKRAARSRTRAKRRK